MDSPSDPLVVLLWNLLDPATACISPKKSVSVTQHESATRARVGSSQVPQGTLQLTTRILAGVLATTLFAGTAAAQDAIPTSGGSATSPIGYLLIGLTVLAAIHQFTDYTLWPPSEARDTLNVPTDVKDRFGGHDQIEKAVCSQ